MLSNVKNFRLRQKPNNGQKFLYAEGAQEGGYDRHDPENVCV